MVCRLRAYLNGASYFQRNRQRWPSTQLHGSTLQLVHCIGQSSHVVSTIGIGDTLCLPTCNTYTFTRKTDCILQVRVMLNCRWLRRRASRKHHEHWRKLPMWSLSHRQLSNCDIYSHSTWSPQRRTQPSSSRCRWTLCALSLANDAVTRVMTSPARHVIKSTVILAADDGNAELDGGDDRGRLSSVSGFLTLLLALYFIAMLFVNSGTFVLSRCCPDCYVCLPASIVYVGQYRSCMRIAYRNSCSERCTTSSRN